MTFRRRDERLPAPVNDDSPIPGDPVSGCVLSALRAPRAEPRRLPPVPLSARRA